MQHTSQAVDQIAAAEEVCALSSDRESAICARVVDELLTVGLGRRHILGVIVIVEDDATCSQRCGIGCAARHARGVGLGELHRSTALIQLNGAVARKFEIFRHRQRVAESHAHAFACFVERVDVTYDWQRDHGGRNQPQIVAGIGHHDRTRSRGGDLGHAVEFGHDARDFYPLPFGDSRRTGIAKNEDAFRRVRVGVGISVLLLQEETGQFRRPLIVADYDPFNRDRRTRYRR